MISGFDYGTSNCAMGILQSEAADVILLPLEQGKAFMPSTLYALERELICEQVGLGIVNPTDKEIFLSLRSNSLAQARRIRQQESIGVSEQSLFFGRAAFEEYYEFPEEGYFVKSPKSFLGASGLRPEQVFFFEDIVTAMMQNVKRQAEKSAAALGLDSNAERTIEHTVIGRPVNFQGLNSERSNKQAIDILTTSAKRAGFKSVEFLFEPIAAGLNFEAKLTADKTVLVVDIGGGTTDCAMVRMGPNHKNKEQRQQDFIGHSGERIGGNDLDIQLAGSNLMPLFGMGSDLKNGNPVSSKTFWDAVTTNDIGAQSTFNSLQTELYLDQLVRDSAAPELIRRFIKMRDDKQNHHLVRSSEQCKIELSNASEYRVDLSFIEQDLSEVVTRELFAAAVNRPVGKMTALMDEAIMQAGCKPDLVYVTGGSAQSPVIRQAIKEKIGDVEVVDGDHFGSVASGLTVWADRIF
ncbi:MAG: molecular chaperone [Oleispira sp.]|nr:molecular chaperone [Oleispira sp.]MBL4882444.1 molecular chaperone [Oleispira sp.]